MKDCYHIRFNYPNGKVEYYRDENTLQKPFDSKELAGKYILETAIKIKEEYEANPYGQYSTVVLEKI